jgi:hypothetical protein
VSPGKPSAGLQARLVGLVLFVPSTTLIGLSAWLTPDPSGIGTHQQLGLSACAILATSGVPCPMCGMTTTFSLMAHFSPLQALQNQPFGVVLFALTVLGAVVGASEMIKPAKILPGMLRWTVARDRALAGLLLGAMIAAWAYKVAIIRNYFPWQP